MENRCPISPSTPPRSLGALSRDLLDGGFEGIELPSQSTLDSLSTAELKLETDAMMALVSSVVTLGIRGDKLEQAIADSAMEDAEPDVYILNQFADKTPNLFHKLTRANLRKIREAEEFDRFMDRLEVFRHTYYERKEAAIAQSPPDTHPENVYSSVEYLLDTGINTFGIHAPGAVQATDSLAHKAGLQGAERVAFVRDSGNALMSLAKLSLRDLERYVVLRNLPDLVGESVLYASVKLASTKSDSKPVAIYNTDVFRKMREFTPDKEYPDRFHEGCVGAVALFDRGSVIQNLWGTYVGALDKAGFWKAGGAVVTSESTD